MPKKLTELEIEVLVFNFLNKLIEHIDTNTDLNSAEIFTVIRESLKKHETITEEVEAALNDNSSVVDLIQRVGRKLKSQ